MSFSEIYDVIVVGGGNAGFSAATTAAQHGAKRVLLVEKAPENNAGGNTYFTAAGYRTVFGGLQDLLPILYQPTGVRGLPKELESKIEMAPYTKEDFHAVCTVISGMVDYSADFCQDINRVTKGRADPLLANVLVDESRDTIQWMVDNGARFMLSFNRQAFLVDGKYKFWGGMVMNMIGEWFCQFFQRIYVVQVTRSVSACLVRPHSLNKTHNSRSG